MQAATRRWELAQVMRIPLPTLDAGIREELARLAGACCRLEHEETAWNETSRYFRGMPWHSGHLKRVTEMSEEARQQSSEIRARVSSHLEEIERIAQTAYGLSKADISCIRAFTGQTGAIVSQDEEEDEPDGDSSQLTEAEVARRIVSLCFGCKIGRWSHIQCSALEGVDLDPFAPLPESPPAMSLLPSCNKRVCQPGDRRSGVGSCR